MILIRQVGHYGLRIVCFYHFEALFDDLKEHKTTLVAIVFEYCIIDVGRIERRNSLVDMVKRAVIRFISKRLIVGSAPFEL